MNGEEVERERARTLALLAVPRDGQEYGDLTDTGAVHELADRTCEVRVKGDFIHDGARCIRCHGPWVNPHDAFMATVNASPAVVDAHRELDRLDALVDQAEQALGRAVNAARRRYYEARRQAAQ